MVENGRKDECDDPFMKKKEKKAYVIKSKKDI